MDNSTNVDTATKPYRVADLARLLDCSPQHIRRMVRAKAIPGAFRVGRLIRFVRADVDAWMRARIQAGDGQAAGGDGRGQ